MRATSYLGVSESDTAFERFKEIRRTEVLVGPDSAKLSEADTRAKLIDPLFRDVLGWGEAEIRREAPAAQGYADYVLGSDQAYLLVEAKRSKPRFKLKVQSRLRRLKLEGPHLLANKKIRPYLEQARAYATTLGAPFAVVTNGSQFIVFRGFVMGSSWRAGSAIVFHDLDDVEADFPTFLRVMGRSDVCSGNLADFFDEIERLTTPLYVPKEHVRSPNQELVRNPLWPKMSKILSPLLSDQPGDPEVQAEIINNCYVSTPLSDEADKSLDSLIRDLAPPYLEAAGAHEVARQKKSTFSYWVERDVKEVRPGVYILTGGVGSGKTTFLKRFASVDRRDLVREYCVWLHLDFLTIGNVPSAEIDTSIHDFAFRDIRRHLEHGYPQYCPSTGEEVRELFAEEIQRAEMTTLYGLEKDTPEYRQTVGALVDALMRDDESFSRTLLGKLRGRGLRTVVVLDNTDQLGESFQERVFLFSQELSDKFGSLCIVALREEKFFAAYRRGIFDAFGDRRFHIGSPDLQEVLRKRLSYGREKLRAASQSGVVGLKAQDAEKVDLVLGAFIRATTERNRNIVRMLASVSNGDMRHSLDLFRSFVSSGNTDVEKIAEIERQDGDYRLPFHEFAKSAILGSRRYFDAATSHIVNMFNRTEAASSSHLTGLRVLARLSSAQGVASQHGQGFVQSEKLLREYRQSFVRAEDFLLWCAELLRRGLIESEPPRANDIRDAEALRISGSGAYYWRYLVRAFAYLDLVFVDTAIASKELARRLGVMAETSDLTVRIDRVQLFLEYLSEQEREELRLSALRLGPYREPLMEGVRRQVSKETKLIKRKAGGRRAGRNRRG